MEIAVCLNSFRGTGKARPNFVRLVWLICRWKSEVFRLFTFTRFLNLPVFIVRTKSSVESHKWLKFWGKFRFRQIFVCPCWVFGGKKQLETAMSGASSSNYLRLIGPIIAQSWLVCFDSFLSFLREFLSCLGKMRYLVPTRFGTCNVTFCNLVNA